MRTTGVLAVAAGPAPTVASAAPAWAGTGNRDSSDCTPWQLWVHPSGTQLIRINGDGSTTHDSFDPRD